MASKSASGKISVPMKRKQLIDCSVIEKRKKTIGENEKVKLIATDDGDRKDGTVDISDNDPIPSPPKELPKGFFDDPKVDAKIRNTPFKDPLEEEMDLFKKTIVAETIKAETMVEESLEELQIDRDYEEVDEQINQWAKVNELQVKAEKLKEKLTNESKDNRNSEDEEEDLDLSEINVFSKWRAKSITQETK
ncbi:zinc finger protein 830-like [Panonychus citri]|uniref:zinc finger protein 830-like n=1 Tax=Panonychus citri TaxID=50023 RepID=UPI002308280C|nr:zinc finger protein 830-like [Panonychus citri]XP_053204507.1 zinc finger protein 830-like [Panonychus citri]